MKVLACCVLIAISLTTAMASHLLIGEPPRLMLPQHPNVYVYENNSVGERQHLNLPCPLMDTTSVTFQWFRNMGSQMVMVPPEMIDQMGTLTVSNITEGEYASTDGVNYYCVASRNIGKGNYTASVRSRTITVFYASFNGFTRMAEEEVSVPVAIGSDVALECDVLDAQPPPQIRWLRDGNVIAEDTNNNVIRFLDGGCFLYMRRLTADDLMPMYRCEVTNVFLDLLRMAPTTYRLVDNLTQGVLRDYKQIGNLTAFVGNTSFEFAYIGGLFATTASSNGTLNILFRNGDEISNIGNIARISIIDTVGMFNLRAQVRVDGEDVSRFGSLRVHRLPSITSSPDDSRELVVGLENLNYMCEYEGSPMPKIEWYFNGQAITAESGISISGNNLIIASPQVSNSGIYQCVVRNDFGDDQASWLLEIRPSIQTDVKPHNFTVLNAFDDRDLGALIVQENGTTVNFFVDVVADPCPDITWFFNGTALGPSNATFTYDNACAAGDARSPNWRFDLTVTPLTEETSGNYTASFSNIAGTTPLPRSAYFTVPAPVSVTDLTLSLPCLKEGQTVTLRCNIHGFPRPSIQFSVNDIPITPGMGRFANFIVQDFYDEITILNVNSSAEGRYTCIAEAEAGQQQVMSRDYVFCKADGCPIIVLSHGKVVITPPNPVASLSCNVGYKLRGDNTQTCQSNGTWSGGEPQCEAVECPTIVLSHGEVVITPPNPVASLSCNIGYKLRGDNTRTCQNNGTWSGSEPQCDLDIVTISVVLAVTVFIMGLAITTIIILALVFIRVKKKTAVPQHIYDAINPQLPQELHQHQNTIIMHTRLQNSVEIVVSSTSASKGKATRSISPYAATEGSIRLQENTAYLPSTNFSFATNQAYGTNINIAPKIETEENVAYQY